MLAACPQVKHDQRAMRTGELNADYPSASSKEFTQMTSAILKEFGERYGEKIAGYWFDGFYQCFEKYPDFSFHDFYEMCKAGNSKRIIAVNSWIYPSVTEWQDYWAGETANPVELPVNGTNERGPGQGLRYQALLIMEPYWVQQKVEMPKPQFDAQRLGDYISGCMKNGGAVTINLGIYQDGSVGIGIDDGHGREQCLGVGMFRRAGGEALVRNGQNRGRTTTDVREQDGRELAPPGAGAHLSRPTFFNTAWKRGSLRRLS